MKRRQASLSIKENETNAQELYKEQKRKKNKQPNKLPKDDLDQYKGKRPKQTNAKNKQKRRKPKRTDLNTKHNKITFSKGNHSDLETSKKMQLEISKLSCQSSTNP